MNIEEEFFDSHEEEKTYKWEDLLKISDSHINHQNINIISVLGNLQIVRKKDMQVITKIF